MWPFFWGFSVQETAEVLHFLKNSEMLLTLGLCTQLQNKPQSRALLFSRWRPPSSLFQYQQKNPNFSRKRPHFWKRRAPTTMTVCFIRLEVAGLMLSSKNLRLVLEHLYLFFSSGNLLFLWMHGLRLPLTMGLHLDPLCLHLTAWRLAGPIL